MDVIGQTPPFLVDAAGIVTAVMAIVLGVGVLSRLRPVRWLWRRNVSDPLSRWGEQFVTAGAGAVVEKWHDEHVAPVLTELGDKVERATAWAEVLAAREGLPPVDDPRTLLRSARDS